MYPVWTGRLWMHRLSRQWHQHYVGDTSNDAVIDLNTSFLVEHEHENVQMHKINVFVNLKWKIKNGSLKCGGLLIKQSRDGFVAEIGKWIIGLSAALWLRRRGLDEEVDRSMFLGTDLDITCMHRCDTQIFAVSHSLELDHIWIYLWYELCGVGAGWCWGQSTSE